MEGSALSSPLRAGAPSTNTRPSLMSSFASRRDHFPVEAINLSNLCVSTAIHLVFNLFLFSLSDSVQKINKKEAHSESCALGVLALPIFPGRLQPSIFGAGELNCRVRDGNGWTLTLINTNYLLWDNTLKTEQRYFRDGKAIACILLVGQALGRLVRISCIHYCTSTFRLSTR